jgi:DNA polymerase III alpha subunit
MITDKFGQQVYTEQDLCDFFLRNPDRRLDKVLVSSIVDFDPNLYLEYIPNIISYQLENLSIDEFDNKSQSNWFIPEEYKQMDIAQYVLEQCKNDVELQRAGTELLMYQERDMFILLKYLKYLVDTMRKNNIVWGVGRGSSVASFVLFLLGVHRINSLYYDLSIEEFLK